MTRRSLRLRLLIAAAGAIGIALLAAGLALVLLFERNLELRYGAELDGYINQIAGGLILDTEGDMSLSDKLADPRFDRVYGGLYWQAVNETTNQALRSRSLWDVRLDLPADQPPPGAVHIHEIAGPRGTMLLAHERRLIYTSGGHQTFVRIVVAIDHAEIDILRMGFARDLFLSLLVLALVLVAASCVQVSLGLRPLGAIKAGIAAIRGGGQARLSSEMPDEVMPLVEEVNALLEAQAYAAKRAQDRAADLAHGFKTPLTALFGDVKRLRDKGETAVAADIEATAQIMRRHIERELARSRVRKMRAIGTPIAPVVESLIRTLVRTPGGESVRFERNCPESVSVAMETDDLIEVLGNLLENAVRHAKGRVIVSAGQEAGVVTVVVEDDGSGMDDQTITSVTAPGTRLDTAIIGAGLGLTIVNDVLEIYGQTLQLGPSKFGGLQATFSAPAA